MTSRRLIRRALRRPVLTSTSALALTAVVAAGVAVSAQEPSSADAGAAMRPTAMSTPLPAEIDPRPLAAERRLEIAAQTHRQQLAKKKADHRKAVAHQKALKAKRAEARRERAAKQARASRSVSRVSISGGSAKSIARRMLASHGWGSSEFGCLESLWAKESGWSSTASNPSSGAYGIPQALPGSKMASAGSDWRTNPATQIKWGLGYIDNRYGSPCGAWSHSRSNGWY